MRIQLLHDGIERESVNAAAEDTKVGSPPLSARCYAHIMTLIKTYSSRIEADLASIALSAAGIAATIVGVGVGMEGGAEGVQLMVANDQVADALRILGTS